DSISPIVNYEATTFFIEAEADCQASMPDFSQIFSISDKCTSSELLDISQSPIVGVSLTGFIVCSLTVNDESGNSTIFEFTINVTDTTAPIFSCPEPDTITLAFGELTYFVNGNEFDIISLSDNCDGPFLITNDYNGYSSLVGAEFWPGTIDVTWSVTDFYGNMSECEFTSVVSLTSVEDEIWKNIQIYPNPVEDKLNIISSQNQIEMVSITDLNGRIVWDKIIKTPDIIICDVSELVSGMYILSICSNHKILKYKLIKN
ncbi:MAG: T9SS type A sorting domain-containing protein, partial [Ignavibacteriaceae bacterium]|nr:T9SS type A sorting domain-containing protein [Ignavibacteriaceae bacterium]